MSGGPTIILTHHILDLHLLPTVLSRYTVSCRHKYNPVYNLSKRQ